MRKALWLLTDENANVPNKTEPNNVVSFDMWRTKWTMADLMRRHDGWPDTQSSSKNVVSKIRFN